ncbi:hypothetical protein CBR_g12137 [Chara braunii]|uniref:Integrase zinc-binding domain-containing protein n=1 Tax=Chara braunii TaxID=69332 RepID=A0A388KRA4_CHABU|nr:hypothetical protein CBR_g12137 [Chara braunii]|eukprot:GBG72567.1 hypothetical protein CBR_g12137 [Chara braunii]
MPRLRRRQREELAVAVMGGRGGPLSSRNAASEKETARRARCGSDGRCRQDGGGCIPKLGCAAGFSDKEAAVVGPDSNHTVFGEQEDDDDSGCGQHEVELIKEPLTIEYGHEQADKTFRIAGEMSFLVNYLIHEDRLRMMSEEGEGSEIREAFREAEYDGGYKRMGMRLNGELREDEVEPVVRQKSKDYVIRYGHLFKKSADGISKRVVCGIARQLDVMAALHDGVAGGHRSARMTLKKIQHLFFWEGMSKMVIDFCRSCLPCQRRSNVRFVEPLNPRYVAEPGAVVHLDLLVMPPGINRYRYIFDARDNLTGFVDGCAIRDRTGHVLAECIEEYYLRYPFVREFVMDRGGEFRAGEDVKTKLSTEELLELRARQVMITEERVEEAAAFTTESRQADKEIWDKAHHKGLRVRKEPLKIEDIVLLYETSLEKQWSRKLDSRWLGPYRIIRKS